MRATLNVESIFGTRGRTAVLRVLHAVQVPMNAAQVARSAGLTRAAAGAVLAELESLRIVGGNQVGWSRVYWLLRDNFYTQRIIAPAFDAEEAMGDELEDDLRRAFRDLCVSVVVFGSYARDEQTVDSDVDVALVAADPDAKRAVEEALLRETTPFFRRWGAPLSALVYDLEHAATLQTSSPALYAEIEQYGVVVSGLMPSEWSKRASV